MDLGMGTMKKQNKSKRGRIGVNTYARTGTGVLVVNTALAVKKNELH